ncbi:MULTISPECIES: EamA family transporter [Myxococcus]|uniref:EamA family transporter n=1 Tax=Myxococcus TaxID=32 RepID=UPI0013D18D61|nr:MULTISPECIES: EamA family transporter [Myxococcus]NVJ23407.1 EamA family transporter [Myxococcus sp. AM011]
MAFRDIALAVLVAALWGFNFVVIKEGLDTFPPLFFSALRFLSAAFPAVLFLRRGTIAWSTLLKVGIVLGVVKYSLLYLGVKLGMPAGLSSLAIQSQVIFTAVLSAYVLKDAPSAWQRVGMGVALSGILLLASTRQGSVSREGFALVIGAAMAWSVANILIKKAAVDTFRLMVWMSVVPPLPLLVLSFLFEQGQWEALPRLGTFKGLGAVLYTGLLATIVAFGIWGHLFRKYSPNVVAPFALLVPVFGMASSMLVLGERLSGMHVAAALLVLAGLVLVVLGKRLPGLGRAPAVPHPLTKG